MYSLLVICYFLLVTRDFSVAAHYILLVIFKFLLVFSYFLHVKFTCHLFSASKQEEFQFIKYEILVTLFYKWEVIETASNNLKETKIFIRRYVMLPNNVMLFFCFLNLQMIFSRISQNYCWEY